MGQVDGKIIELVGMKNRLDKYGGKKHLVCHFRR